MSVAEAPRTEGGGVARPNGGRIVPLAILVFIAILAYVATRGADDEPADLRSSPPTWLGDDPVGSEHWTCPACLPSADASQPTVRALPNAAGWRVLVLCDAPPGFASLAWADASDVPRDIAADAAFDGWNEFESFVRGLADGSGGKVVARARLEHPAHAAAVLDDGELVIVRGEHLGDASVAVLERRAADGRLLIERRVRATAPVSPPTQQDLDQGVLVGAPPLPRVTDAIRPLWIEDDGVIALGVPGRRGVEFEARGPDLEWLDRGDALAHAARVAVDDGDPVARIRALDVLEHAAHPDVVALLRAGLDSRHARVREFCEDRLAAHASGAAASASTSDAGR